MAAQSEQERDLNMLCNVLTSVKARLHVPDNCAMALRGLGLPSQTDTSIKK